MTEYLVAELPLYYMGWVVQPMMKGFYVYARYDLCKSKSSFFVTLDAAYDSIDEVVDKS